MEATMFFLLNSLDVERGGLTKASLKQANTFAEMGYDTYLLTFNFNTRYANIYDALINLGQLNEKVKVLNLYDYLGYNDAPPIKQMFPEEKGYLDPHVGKNAFRVYENGMYTKYKKFHKDGSLDFIDYFNEQRYRTKKEIYDEYGLVRKVSFMDITLNKPRQMVFYKNNMKAYLSKWVNPQTEQAIRVNLFDDHGKITKIFNNDLDLKIDWLEEVIAPFTTPVIVSDARNTDLVMLGVKNKNAVKIWRLHSSHLKTPFEPDSEIAPTVQTGINNLDTLDAALFLTEQQKIDIENRFGKKTNLFALPHAMESFAKDHWFSSALTKNKRVATVVSRYSAIKNLDHIIKAFQIVVEEVPDAKLEFWGSGPDKEKLQQLITEAKLTDSITLNGYTNEPDQIYQKALFSILASKTEGFSLSVLESMSNGTAVVSYDIRYGPAELIDDGIDGILVQKNNIEMLAQAMIEMFNNPSKAIKMGKEAKKKVQEKFNKQSYSEAWKRIVNAAIENRINKNKKGILTK